MYFINIHNSSNKIRCVLYEENRWKKNPMIIDLYNFNCTAAGFCLYMCVVYIALHSTPCILIQKYIIHLQQRGHTQTHAHAHSPGKNKLNSNNNIKTNSSMSAAD